MTRSGAEHSGFYSSGWNSNFWIEQIAQLDNDNALKSVYWNSQEIEEHNTTQCTEQRACDKDQLENDPTTNSDTDTASTKTNNQTTTCKVEILVDIESEDENSYGNNESNKAAKQQHDTIQLDNMTPLDNAADGISNFLESDYLKSTNIYTRLKVDDSTVFATDKKYKHAVEENDEIFTENGADTALEVYPALVKVGAKPEVSADTECDVEGINAYTTDIYSNTGFVGSETINKGDIIDNGSDDEADWDSEKTVKHKSSNKDITSDSICKECDDTSNIITISLQSLLQANQTEKEPEIVKCSLLDLILGRESETIQKYLDSWKPQVNQAQETESPPVSQEVEHKDESSPLGQKLLDTAQPEGFINVIHNRDMDMDIRKKDGVAIKTSFCHFNGTMSPQYHLVAKDPRPTPDQTTATGVEYMQNRHQSTPNTGKEGSDAAQTSSCAQTVPNSAIQRIPGFSSQFNFEVQNVCSQSDINVINESKEEHELVQNISELGMNEESQSQGTIAPWTVQDRNTQFNMDAEEFSSQFTAVDEGTMQTTPEPLKQENQNTSEMRAFYVQESLDIPTPSAVPLSDDQLVIEAKGFGNQFSSTAYRENVTVQQGNHPSPVRESSRLRNDSDATLASTISVSRSQFIPVTGESNHQYNMGSNNVLSPSTSKGAYDFAPHEYYEPTEPTQHPRVLHDVYQSEGIYQEYPSTYHSYHAYQTSYPSSHMSTIPCTVSDIPSHAPGVAGYPTCVVERTVVYHYGPPPSDPYNTHFMNAPPPWHP
ncbi:hypothetical protein DFQ28_000966 [Apophysomyces sp. BC1034]|nr:hypothetical protein DFQ30_008751 [Apophysomyces sp. BC1015]KAG0183310.1 hypothetical protein DFQ29_006879 [Apophysomyces sp. BC1021]KAG0194247.1 hypothetical protein DFQ28_000966 [Apophysomyces sp. BC1034]